MLPWSCCLSPQQEELISHPILLTLKIQAVDSRYAKTEWKETVGTIRRMARTGILLIFLSQRLKQMAFLARW